MNLTSLLISFAIVAGLLTFILGKWVSKPKSTGLFFLQNFCGVWFIFSGFVKAIDPMGTAFKMEQYFAAFEQTVTPTWLKFMAPVFPFLTSYTIAFSIFMILLEILIGLALIIGYAPKTTARIFFILLIFFTVLTGFTYLTGYVPSNKNFFDFAAWGDYDKNQMRVNDCGCFGDFLKLDPKISFFKDLGLLIPGLIFLFFAKSFHSLWTPGVRKWIMVSALLGFSAFSWYNTFMNEPVWDFRPFKNGSDIATARKNELDAAQAVQIESASIKNRKSGETIQLPYASYLKEFKKYPKEDWAISFQNGESQVPKTKVSDFLIMDQDGKDITLELLNYPEYSLMVSAFKIHGSSGTRQIEIQDTLYRDSVYLVKKDTFTRKVIVSIGKSTIEQNFFNPEVGDSMIFTNKINPLVNQFIADKVRVYAVTGGLGTVQMKDLALATGAEYPIYQADDILLKTLMRSNPGLILWKSGRIVQKWHYKHLPTVEELKSLMK